MANMGIPISRHTIVTAFTAPPTIVHSNHGMSVVKRGYDRQARIPCGTDVAALQRLRYRAQRRGSPDWPRR